jgi:hypothetical protein
MSSISQYREYAADCVRQARSEDSADDKTIMLNVALAWLRLAQQTEALQETDGPPTVPEVEPQDELTT